MIDYGTFWHCQSEEMTFKQWRLQDCQAAAFPGIQGCESARRRLFLESKAARQRIFLGFKAGRLSDSSFSCEAARWWLYFFLGGCRAVAFPGIRGSEAARWWLHYFLGSKAARLPGGGFSWNPLLRGCQEVFLTFNARERLYFILPTSHITIIFKIYELKIRLNYFHKNKWIY